MESRRRDGGGPRRDQGGPRDGGGGGSAGGPGLYRGPRRDQGGPRDGSAGGPGLYRGPRRERTGPRGGGGQYRTPPVGTGPRGTFYVRSGQPMYVALEVIERLGNEGRLKLKARGESIPTAVAVANIVTGRLIKGASKIENVSVDSQEIKELGGVLSTIEITLSKSGA